MRSPSAGLLDSANRKYGNKTLKHTALNVYFSVHKVVILQFHVFDQAFRGACLREPLDGIVYRQMVCFEWNDSFSGYIKDLTERKS